jgi:hypothetical protein
MSSRLFDHSADLRILWDVASRFVAPPALALAIGVAPPAHAQDEARYKALVPHLKVALVHDVDHDNQVMTAIGIALMRSLRGGRPTIALTIAIDTNTYDIYTAAVAANAAAVAAGPVNVILTINSGVLLYSTSTAAYALTTGSGFQAGTNILVINNGTIFGCGGKGGDGGNQSGTAANGRPGENGGTAIGLTWDVTIDNTNGYIYGAGGGAGGGADYYEGGLPGAGGGGGGQGIGAPINSYGLKSNFQPATGPVDGEHGVGAGRGGLGGAYGEDTFYGVRAGWGGSNTQNFQAGSPPWINQDWAQAGCNGQGAASHTGGAAGTGGDAIHLGGKAVTWSGGNNGTQVKGAVA